MIEKTPLDDGAAMELTFVVAAEHARGAVHVAGDFNGWDVSGVTLTRSGEHLVGSTVVAAGRRYAFRYLTGGAWFNDEAADAYEPNEFGGYNCVVET